jgi:hypothetical protein
MVTTLPKFRAQFQGMILCRLASFGLRAALLLAGSYYSSTPSMASKPVGFTTQARESATAVPMARTKVAKGKVYYWIMDVTTSITSLGGVKKSTEQRFVKRVLVKDQDGPNFRLQIWDDAFETEPSDDIWMELGPLTSARLGLECLTNPQDDTVRFGRSAIPQDLQNLDQASVKGGPNPYWSAALIPNSTFGSNKNLREPMLLAMACSDLKFVMEDLRRATFPGLDILAGQTRKVGDHWGGEIVATVSDSNDADYWERMGRSVSIQRLATSDNHPCAELLIEGLDDLKRRAWVQTHWEMTADYRLDDGILQHIEEVSEGEFTIEGVKGSGHQRTVVWRADTMPNMRNGKSKSRS